MKVTVNFSLLTRLLKWFRGYNVDEGGIKIEYEILRKHTAGVHTSTSAKLTIQGRTWFHGSTEYIRLEYPDASTTREHADYLALVSEALRKIAVEMEEPPK